MLLEEWMIIPMMKMMRTCIQKKLVLTVAGQEHIVLIHF